MPGSTIMVYEYNKPDIEVKIFNLRLSSYYDPHRSKNGGNTIYLFIRDCYIKLFYYL